MLMAACRFIDMQRPQRHAHRRNNRARLKMDRGAKLREYIPSGRFREDSVITNAVYGVLLRFTLPAASHAQLSGPQDIFFNVELTEDRRNTPLSVLQCRGLSGNGCRDVDFPNVEFWRFELRRAFERRRSTADSFLADRCSDRCGFESRCASSPINTDAKKLADNVQKTIPAKRSTFACRPGGSMRRKMEVEHQLCAQRASSWFLHPDEVVKNVVSSWPEYVPDLRPSRNLDRIQKPASIIPSSSRSGIPEHTISTFDTLMNIPITSPDAKCSRSVPPRKWLADMEPRPRALSSSIMRESSAG